MSFIYSLVARAEVALPRSLSVLNLLSLILFAVALVLPVNSSIVVLILSMFVQAAFFRVMYRQKAGVSRLLKRLAFLLISSVTFFIVLFQHGLL